MIDHGTPWKKKPIQALHRKSIDKSTMDHHGIFCPPWKPVEFRVPAAMTVTLASRATTFAVVAGEAPHVEVLDAAPRLGGGCAGGLGENGRVAKIAHPVIDRFAWRSGCVGDLALA
jgi:hypothetical protein